MIETYGVRAPPSGRAMPMSYTQRFFLEGSRLNSKKNEILPMHKRARLKNTVVVLHYWAGYTGIQILSVREHYTMASCYLVLHQAILS